MSLCCLIRTLVVANSLGWFRNEQRILMIGQCRSKQISWYQRVLVINDWSHLLPILNNSTKKMICYKTEYLTFWILFSQNSAFWLTWPNLSEMYVAKTSLAKTSVAKTSVTKMYVHIPKVMSQNGRQNGVVEEKWSASSRNFYHQK